jgi:hypothetical protein
LKAAVSLVLLLASFIPFEWWPKPSVVVSVLYSLSFPASE